jgi:hypothetical protein
MDSVSDPMFVQSTDCKRIYNALRDADDRLWTVRTDGCPRCNETKVRTLADRNGESRTPAECGDSDEGEKRSDD